METAEPYGGKTLITELNQGPDIVYQDDNNPEDLDSDEDDQQQNIFNVSEAVPPTDYDAPYSAMPATVVLKKVKQKVKNSYIKMAKLKAKEMSEKLKYKPGVKNTTGMAAKKSTNPLKKDLKLP